MKKLILKGFALALVLTTSAVAALNSDQTMQKFLNEELVPVQPGLIYGHIAQIFAEGVPKAHFSHHFLDDEIARKALDNYLDSLDYDHSIFLATDIATFREQVVNLDDFLRRGQIQFAYDVFTLYKKRLHDRITYIDKLLKGNFDYTIKETYLWKRKDAPWPADRKEWDDIWRKKVKHELLGHEVNKIMRKTEASSENPKVANQDVLIKDESKLLSPQEHIRKKYVQYWNVVNAHDSEWILQLYLTAFAQSYDVHSSYLSPRANEDFDIDMKLSLTGIGALLSLDEGAARVVRLIPGGPAELDGRLKTGDKIVAVAQNIEQPVDILYWPLYKSVRLIRGEKGSTVILSVIPAEDVTGTTIQKINLVRDEIKLENRAAKLDYREIQNNPNSIKRKIAVLTLPEFYADFAGKKRGDKNSRSSSQDVKKLLHAARTAEVDGLILDLRNNGGGSLQEAIEMTGYFIDEGPVVQVKGSQRINVLKDPFPSKEFNGPMLVLVNRMSASASEILAGALQDYGRALIVGDSKTHGKGTVQALFPLDRYNDELGALKITTANFYRVNGESTQLKGVTPDIVIPSALDVVEIGEEYLPNVLEWSEVESTTIKSSDQVLPFVKQLTTNSHHRLDNDVRYGQYQELVKRLKKRNSINELSLQLDERVTLAQKDKELENFQNQLASMLKEDDTDKKGTSKPNGEKEATVIDLILEESLQILGDLINLKKKGETIAAGDYAVAQSGRH